MSPRKQKPFRATKEVKRRARREIGSPPPSQRHESRKHKPPKHKKQELQTAEEGTQPPPNPLNGGGEREIPLALRRQGPGGGWVPPTAREGGHVTHALTKRIRNSSTGSGPKEASSDMCAGSKAAGRIGHGS